MTSSRLGLFSLLLLAGAAQAQNLRDFEAVEPHMGTLFRIKLYAASETQAQQALQAAFARVGELDNILSDYKPNSELDELSQKAIGHPVPVSEDLFRVLSASQKLAEETGGAFDITIGPLTHLWRNARKNGRPPDASSVAAAKAKCGYWKMHLDPAAHTVELDEAGMQLDVGAIAKGDAADQALAVLSQHGIKRALVAASGDLAFSDAPPGKHGLDHRSRFAGYCGIAVYANSAAGERGRLDFRRIRAAPRRIRHTLFAYH